jgi:hypothetical protein
MAKWSPRHWARAKQVHSFSQLLDLLWT